MTSAVNGLEERFTKHEGRRLRYLIGGTGPPLLLCHGFIGSAENFNDWFDVLLTAADRRSPRTSPASDARRH